MDRYAAKLRVLNNVLRLPAGAHEPVAVTEKALVNRINRHLRRRHDLEATDLYRLKKTRSAQARVDHGDYYLYNCRTHSVVKKQIDLDAYARDLGALKPFERVQGNGWRQPAGE